MTIGANTLTVLTAARDTSLVALATVKTELAITDGSQDAKLTRLIAAVGRVFAGELGFNREPWRQQYREELGGFGRQLLYLARFPIESVAMKLRGSDIDAATYKVAGRFRDALFREFGWAWTTRKVSGLTFDPVPGSEDLAFEATYWAGWLMPGQVATWVTGAKALGAWARATDPTKVLRFEVTTAGSSGGSEPVWPAAAGGTVVDGTVTWTAVPAFELPADVEQAALDAVVTLYGYSSGRYGVVSESFEGARLEYADVSRYLPSSILDVLGTYR